MRTNLDRFFKSNTNLESNGIWMEISDDLAFKVKRMGGANYDFKKSYAARLKPYARRIANGTMDESKEERLYIEVFVESCLIDWKGVEVDGELVEFSKQQALDILTDPSYSDLVGALIAHATEAGNYREEQLVDLGKS